MNLHSIAMGAVDAVNPTQHATWQANAGYTTSAAGKRTPTYAAAIDIYAQVQPLSSRDLRQLDSINLGGAMNAIYVSAAVKNVLRVSQTGGDLVTMDDGTVWLTTAVLERWPADIVASPDWVKVAVTLQNGS